MGSVNKVLYCIVLYLFNISPILVLWYDYTSRGGPLVVCCYGSTDVLVVAIEMNVDEKYSCWY